MKKMGLACDGHAVGMCKSDLKARGGKMEE
jgi:hypothetical protein